MTSEEFRKVFYDSPSAIGISLKFNEEFKILSDLQLDDIEKKFCENKKSILISIQSNVDQKFTILWRLEGKKKLLILEVVESYDEDLSAGHEFTINFLIKSLMQGDAGEF